MQRRAAIFGIVALVLGIVALVPVAVPPGSNGALDVADHASTGAIATGTSVTQQFPAQGDALTTVTVYLATYGRVNRGTLHISVFAESQSVWQRLATRDLETATLRDNTYTTLTFSPPLAVLRGQNLRLVMESENPPGDAVTWWANPHVRQDRYRLTANTTPLVGTAVFQVHYRRVSHPLIFSLGTIWRDATPFLTAPWQALLLIGLVGTLASGMLIFRNIPDDDPAPPIANETG